MKSPDYVYTVTSIYRRLLDEKRNSAKAEDKKLEKAFSRGGFTDGYFTGNTFSSMTGIRSEEDKRLSMSEEKGDFSFERTRVAAKLKLKLGEPSEMTLYGVDIDRKVRVIGDIPEAAKNAPLTEDGVKERIAKMGNTLLSLSRDDIELELDEGINLSPSAINKLRRDAAESFESFGREMREDGFAEDDAPALLAASDSGRCAIFFNADTFDALDENTLSYFDKIFLPLADYTENRKSANGVYLPPIIMEDELPRVKKMMKNAKNLGVKYALIGNPSHIELAKEYNLLPIGDFRLNVTNTESRRVWNDFGISDVVVSPELTSGQARRLASRTVVYGRLPLMITERCFMKENFGCEKCGKCFLTDRKGIKFPMRREFDHRNIIFNSAYTYMGDKAEEIRGLPYHFIFTTERKDEVQRIIKAFKERRQFPLDGQMRRMGKRKVD